MLKCDCGGYQKYRSAFCLVYNFFQHETHVNPKDISQIGQAFKIKFCPWCGSQLKEVVG